jgi:hypothetical protein
MYNSWGQFQSVLLVLIILSFLYGAKGKAEQSDSLNRNRASYAMPIKQNNPTENKQEIEWSSSSNSRQFNVKAVGSNVIDLEGLGGSVEINGKTFYLKDARVVSPPKKESKSKQAKYRMTYLLNGINCLWIWEFAYIDKGLEITATLQNTGNITLTIGNWDVVNLLNSHGGRFKAGSNPKDIRFFRWSPWDMRVELLSSNNGGHNSENICLLFDSLSKQCFMSAFITMDRMHCHHEVSFSPAIGIEEYKATCDFGKYKLNPDMRLASEKLSISFYNDPFCALEGWADQIYVLKKPVFAELPPVGIINGTWQISGNRENYEELTLGNARAVRERLKGFDIRYNWISQGNLKGGIPGNWMNSDEFNIPDGLEIYFKRLKNLGFIPGLWVAPFWFCSEADSSFEENRENLLRDCNGRPVSNLMNWGGDFGDITPWTNLHKYFLDGTHPNTVKYIKKIFAYYRNIGVRYYMLDFLEVPGNSCLMEPSQTPLEASRNILKVIRETAGDDTHLQTAVSSTPAFTGLINAARVGRDFGEGRPLQGATLSDWRNATYVLHDYHYANTHYLIQNAAASYFTHRKLYINDLNMLSIDKPIPLEHARIAATIFGLCGGSPLMLGDDYRGISEERLHMVKLCLPRTQDMPVPVDLFDNVFPDGYSRYLKLRVKRPWESYLVLAIFNEDETAYNAEFDFYKLGLDRDKPYRISEFWTEEYCGTYKEHFKYIIPPNSCRLFRISEARKYPWLLSTDMHIQQGAVEIKALNWDEEKMCLSGTATRPAGEVGNLFFLMPRKMRVINNEGLFLMKDLNDMNVVIRKEIRFHNEHEKFEIFFEPWEEKYIVAKPLMPYDTEIEWLNYVKKHGNPGDTRVIE